MPNTHLLESDTQGRLWVKLEDHNNNCIKKYLGGAVYVKKIYKVIDDFNRIELLLEFDYMDETIEYQMPRKNLTRRELLKLSDLGLDINDFNAKYYAEFIQMQEVNKRINNIHANIGWDSIKGKEIFKGYKALGVKSAYVGSLDITPKGDKDSFSAFVNEYIKDTPLTLAMLMGLSATLVGYIGNNVGYANAVYHLYGDSSTGKSTSAALAVSMGSNPIFGENSLMRTFDATENMILKLLVGNYGFSITFDEASMFPSKDFSRFIYRMASGTEKGRLTREGQLKQLGSYSHASSFSRPM